LLELEDIENQIKQLNDIEAEPSDLEDNDEIDLNNIHSTDIKSPIVNSNIKKFESDNQSEHNNYN
jgi:hypothetical protein